MPRLDVDLYKSGIKLARGVMRDGDTLVTEVERLVDRLTPEQRRRVGEGRNIQVTQTSPGFSWGETYSTRVIEEDIPAQTIELRDFMPFDNATPPWVSGGSLMDGETAVIQGVKYWDVHNASQPHSLQYHATFDHYRYEIRPGEAWPYDSSSRSEVRDTVVRPNAVPIWGAYSFMVEKPPEDSAAEWVVLGQMHDQTLVNNPDFALEIDENGTDLIIVYRDGGAALQVTCARASSAWAPDENGLYREFAANKPRIDLNLGLLVEEGRTNSLRNNSMQGAVAGTPGTVPTNWVIAASSGLSTQVVGTGTENGIDYIDWRIFGTSVGGSNNIYCESHIQVAAVNGQTWTSSAFFKRVAGSMANVTQCNNFIVLHSGAGAQIGAVANAFTLTDVLTRAAFTTTLANASVAFIRPAFLFTSVAGAVDLTIRIGWPQLEQGGFVTSPIRTTTAAKARLADQISMALAMSGPVTVFADHTIPAGIASGAKVTWELDNGTNNERRLVRTENTNGNLDVFNVVAGVATYSDVLLVAVAGTRYKTAIRTDTNNFRGAVNGTLKNADASGALPAVSTILRIGSEIGVNYLNGYLRRLTLWPLALSDAQIAQITDLSFSDFFPEGATVDLRFDRWGRYVAHREHLYRNEWYNIVFNYKADPTGADSALKVWLNSELVVDLANVPLGMPDSTGHYWKNGVYRDPATATDILAIRYANMEMGSIDLSDRILNPLPLSRERPTIIPPLDGTEPSLACSFRQKLLSTFEGTYYRLEEGSADQIDRLNDQSVNNWGSAIAGVGGTPTLVLTADVSTANFLGNDSFTNFADINQLFADDDFYWIVRFKCTSISTNEIDSWDNDTIMGDAGRWVGICFRQPNLCVFRLDDNIASDLYVEVPITLNEWATAEMYFDGAAFHGRINGGAWTSQAVGGPITDMTGGWRLGRGLAGKFFRGEISDFAVYPTRLTEELRDRIQTGLAIP